MYTLGIDLHKEFALWALLGPDGTTLWQKRIETDLESLEVEAKILPKPCQAVLEPVGCFWLYAETLERQGIKTHLAHPSDVKLIAKSKNKNDKIDATILAQLLRTDFLPEAYLPTSEIKELRSFLMFRYQLVATRTRAKNRMRMLLNSLNIKTSITDLFGKKGVQFLKELHLSPLCSLQRDELIRIVGTINSQLAIVHAALDRIAEKDDDVQRMMSIPHIGTITALIIKAWVGDFNRFSTASKLVGYAGLAPSVRQSGNKETHGHITKQGPPLLRATLVQAAAGIRPSDGSLYTYYQAKAQTIGVKRARIALAKKLLTIAYRVVVDKTVFVDQQPDTTCHKCSA